jgi:hypothetical protein
MKFYFTLVIMVTVATLNGQLNLPLKFQKDVAKWTNLVIAPEENKVSQNYENRVPPIIVDDTIYTFMNFRGLWDNGISSGYSGFIIKKIHKKTGNIFWEIQRINKKRLERFALSHATLNDGNINITVFDEAPTNAISVWNDAYPSFIAVNRNTGVITDSINVNPQAPLLRPAKFFLDNRENGIETLFTLTKEGYRQIFNDYRSKYIARYWDFEGNFLKEDTFSSPHQYILEREKIFPIKDSLLASLISSQEDNYKKFEMLYTLYDQEFNIINKIDLSLHLRDSLTFAYAYRTNHDYIIIESGYQDFIRKETLLDYHLFDEDGNFVDQITYTLRDGIDNKIRYGHFYPLVDIINKRLLLTRSMQREFTESTRFEIFSSEGDSLQLINTIEVEGKRDHFKTLYGTMMENGDLLLYVQQFVFEQGENQKILFFSWVLLDG